MFFTSRLAAMTLAAMMCAVAPASSQQQPPMQPQPQYQVPPPQPQMQPQPEMQPQPQPPPPQRQPSASTYGPEELNSAGHRFFGNVSRGLASVIERAVSQWGLPNGGYHRPPLGEEGSGAALSPDCATAKGTLYTKNTASDAAPRLLAAGALGRLRLGQRRQRRCRTMTLVYNLPATTMRSTSGTLAASSDPPTPVIGGFRNDTALTAGTFVLVPIRCRSGARLAANIAYLHQYTPRTTWNPVWGYSTPPPPPPLLVRLRIRQRGAGLAFCPLRLHGIVRGSLRVGV